MIRTINLRKNFKGKLAVDSLDLQVNKGDVFGFLGPNGAGKTTAINMMVGIIVPSNGKCLIKDMDISEKPIDVKRIIGYLPDHPGFYPNLTAKQTLEYYSRIFDIEKVEAKKRIDYLLDRVGLGKNNLKVGNYSRGMKQRLGIAHALINDPEVLILDEPTTGLDPEGMEMLRTIIKETAAEGKTVFFSSHVIEEIAHVCNKIGIISSGKLITSGTPREVGRKLQGMDGRIVTVKVKEKMPELSIHGILNVKYFADGAEIQMEGDIVDAISREITGKGATITELKTRDTSLGEIFMDIVYKGGNNEN